METAKRRVARSCRVEVIADAPIASVWRVVADVTRTGEWSHECHHVAWRTIPTPLFVDSSDWSISLEPAGAGTRIVQAFQVTRCPRWWEWIVAWANPRHIDRSAALTGDLRRMAAVAAADARHQPRASRR
jgi:hypothetical protein